MLRQTTKDKGQKIQDAQYNVLCLMSFVLCLTTFLFSCNPISEPPIPTPEPDQTQSKPSVPQKSSKRGVAFDFQKYDDLPLLTPYISWNYNWGPDETDPTIASYFDMSDVEFCPMAWNGGYDANRIKTYVKAHPSCKYLLAFNEPNLKDQCHYTPQQAAQHWDGLVALARELELKIVSPAMNYGTLEGYGDPIVWLDEFFQLVSINDIDAISVHCYMGSASAMKGFIERFEKYNKPIWLTEFCAWESYISSVEAQMNYMCEALNYLEQCDLVERYAWFIPRANGAVDSYPYMQMLTKTQPYELTDVGKVYCEFSSFDKNSYLLAEQGVSAKDYIATSTNNIQLRPTTNPEGKDLMIQLFKEGQSLTYQVQTKQETQNFQLSYTSVQETQCVIYADNEYMGMLTLPAGKNMQTWQTVSNELSYPLSAGEHILKIEMLQGTIHFDNWQLK